MNGVQKERFGKRIKILVFSFLAAVLLTLLMVVWVSALGDATIKMEFYDNLFVEDDTSINYESIYGTKWVAQTFKVGRTGPDADFYIKLVSLRIWFTAGDPGDLTVSIRAVAFGKPTGPDLANVTIDSTTLPNSVAWVNFTMQNDALLSQNTQYAIVLRTTAGSGGVEVRLSHDSDSPTYSGGSIITSPNDGISWVILTSRDTLFQVWAGNTCEVPLSGDWYILCNDFCGFGVNATIPGNVIMSGTGNITLGGNWEFSNANSYIRIGSGCQLHINESGGINR